MASYRDILTPAWLKARYLVGVDLTLDNGDPYPDAVYTQAIDAAIRYIEHELSLTFDPVAIKRERHDAHAEDRSTYWAARLNRGPLISVDAVRLQLNQTQLTELPASWIYVDNKIHGRVALVVSVDGIQNFILSGGVPFLQGVFMSSGYLPGYFVWDYTAGFPIYEGTYTVEAGTNPVQTLALSPEAQEPDYFVDASVTTGTDPDKLIRVNAVSRAVDEVQLQLAAAPAANVTVTWRVMTLPADLLHCVGLRAAMLPLDIAGDLIAGAGVASSSIGVDRLSQSINTTSSATNSGYGARVLQFEREFKAALGAARSKYRTPGLAVF